MRDEADLTVMVAADEFGLIPIFSCSFLQVLLGKRYGNHCLFYSTVEGREIQVQPTVHVSLRISLSICLSIEIDG